MDPLAASFERFRRHGDLQALGQVFDAVAGRLLAVALHLCGNAADAEDVLQQTFLLAMERDVAFDPSRRLEPWLAGLLQNVARNAQRHAARRRVEPLPELAGGDAGPIAAAEREELLALLRTNVDALPPEQRQVLRLQLQHGLSPAEIAVALEVPPGTVRMRIHRGIDALRKLLPAGLAAWMATVFPSRGLAAVKQQVLAAARAKLVAAGAVTTVAIGGALAMKKLAAVVLVVLVIGTAWLWSSGVVPPAATLHDTPPPTGASPATADATGPGDGERAADERVAASPAAAGGDTPGEPGPTELWGRVVDASTAAPIAGAAIELLRCDADELWNLDMEYAERIATLARASSDADGRFRFDVERARQHRLHVAAAGYASVSVLRSIGGAEQVVELSRGASLDGVVRCEGKLLADMQVRIAVRGETAELAKGRTDGGGAFRFTGLPTAAVYVQVSSPSYEEEWTQLDLEAGKAHHVDIELERGKTLRGRVVEATTSAPVVDAEVSDSWTFKRVVRTDADGRFSIAGLKDQNYVMCHVRAVGYASASRNIGGHLGEEAELRLVRGGEVVGRLVTVAGAPVSSAYVAVCSSFMEAQGIQGSDWITASVGSDGRFQVLGLRPDQHYWLLARSSGLGSRVYALARVVGSGERLDVGDVVLRATGGIEGRVVDDSGAPLAAHGVSIRGTNDDSRAWLPPGAAPNAVSQFESRDGRTDSRGVFRFTGVAAGTYQVSARMPGGRDAIVGSIIVRDGAISDGVELIIARGLSIAGRFEYSNGQAPDIELNDMYLNATSTRDPNGYSARIHRDGTFRFDGVADDEYTLSVLQPPKGWSVAAVTGVRAGRTDVKLLLEPSAAVSGRVVDDAGKGVRASVWVQADGVTAGSPILSTDDEGRFRVEVPPAFRGSVSGAVPNDWTQQARVDGVVAGQTDVVITLRHVEAGGRGRTR